MTVIVNSATGHLSSCPYWNCYVEADERARIEAGHPPIVETGPGWSFDTYFMNVGNEHGPVHRLEPLVIYGGALADAQSMFDLVREYVDGETGDLIPYATFHVIAIRIQGGAV